MTANDAYPQNAKTESCTGSGFPSNLLPKWLAVWVSLAPVAAVGALYSSFVRRLCLPHLHCYLSNLSLFNICDDFGKRLETETRGNEAEAEAQVGLDLLSWGGLHRGAQLNLLRRSMSKDTQNVDTE